MLVKTILGPNLQLLSKYRSTNFSYHWYVRLTFQVTRLEYFEQELGLDYLWKYLKFSDNQITL